MGKEISWFLSENTEIEAETSFWNLRSIFNSSIFRVIIQLIFQPVSTSIIFQLKFIIWFEHAKIQRHANSCPSFAFSDNPTHPRRFDNQPSRTSRALPPTKRSSSTRPPSKPRRLPSKTWPSLSPIAATRSKSRKSWRTKQTPGDSFPPTKFKY